MKTSRHWLIDAIEMLGNDIAQVSHLQELLNINGLWDYNLSEEKEWDIRDIMHEYIDRRRVVMNEIRRQFADNWDEKLRCSLKHSIASYMYSTEMYYAEPQNEVLKKVQEWSYHNMIEILSLFLWEEVVSCGRCLADNVTKNVQLQKEQKETDYTATDG